MQKTLWLVSLLAGSLFAADGAALAKKYGCMACHDLQSKKSAPPFRGIANRATRMYGSEAKLKIMESIKNGSKGKYPPFADTQMPPFPSLSAAELNTLAEWILSQKRRGGGRGMGRGGHGGGMGMGRGLF